MRSQPNNVISLTIEFDKLYRYWFEILEPFHHLTKREIDVVASFVKHRQELSGNITDQDLLDRNVMSEEVKKEIREDLNLQPAHFQMIIGKLKKSGVIIDNKINPKYIPRVQNGSNSFQLLFLFTLK